LTGKAGERKVRFKPQPDDVIILAIKWAAAFIHFHETQRSDTMNRINFKREISDTVDHAIERVTKALGAEGFGILTRIDMHSKIKEKTGKEIVPTVILGACNPNLAYEAYTANTDVASLLPCNAVIREIAPGRISVELAAPSGMMRILGDAKLTELAREADTRIERALAGV
jgi:uncharacterized protein (DUF302 family)